MSEILKQIKADLKKAMKVEAEFRKNRNEKTVADHARLDLALAMKEAARAIISMYPELGVKPDTATDKHTTTLLKKYVYMEQTRELFLKNHIGEVDVTGLKPKDLTALYKTKIRELGDDLLTPKIIFAQGYLPKVLPPATDQEIKDWITENLDLNSFKNVMQAMGPIMAHFGERVDGKGVKQILGRIA